MTPTPTMPIETAREPLREALASGRPVIVAAPTGSGKSTQLPGWLADQLDGLIMVVEPRRVACRALATWVAAQRGGAVGDEVGYQVRFDDRVGPKTRIVFVTPGIALNRLASNDGARLAAVLVDEFHERSWEIDLVVALVRRARAQGSRTQLLLCSATLDTQRLVAGLDGRLVQAEGRRFAVEVIYRGDSIPSDEDLDRRVAAAVDATLAEGPEGDILVFLPGKGEIERCGRALAGRPVSLCPVHGALPPDVLMRVFDTAGERRVFLATNVAETSLTLPGVTTVIDSGLVRRRQHQAGRSVLALVPISEASMEQRTGRAGRVAPGRCVRLWSARFEPEATTPPEIARVELDDLVRRAAWAGLSPAALLDAPWVDAPPEFALRAAIERLRQTGVLDRAGELSATGRVQAQLPVGAFAARLLVEPPPELAATVADVVALVEVRRDLLLRGGTSDAVEEARGVLFAGATDDVGVQMIALRRGRARRDGLHPAALAETRKLAASLRRRVGAPAPSPDEPFDPAGLVEYLLARVPEAAFILRPRGRGRDRSGEQGARRAMPWANGSVEVLVRAPWIPGVMADEQPDPPDAGLLLELEWLGQGRGAQGRGRLLLRASRMQLHDAGLTQRVIGPLRLDRRPGRRAVVAALEYRYAGVVIHREEAPLRGAALCEGVARLVMSGRLRKKWGEQLRDDLHLWSLVEQWAKAPPEPVPEPLDYLHHRLEVAGLTELAELELLDGEDLRPDVVARAEALGLCAWELKSLSEDFPRTFAYQGQQYVCRVQWAARRVLLEPERGRGRAGAEPPARVLPRFRGFSVVYRKASRELRLR